MRDAEYRRKYDDGYRNERVWEAVAFSVDAGRSVPFDFRKFSVWRFSELKDERIGRLLHPYPTRIQQRLGLYLQRHELPRIPEEAIPPPQPVPEAE